MNFYLDQEFHERFYKPLFGKKHHIIELISIGLVSEEGDQYYAISKDFDLKAAWENVWLKENVLFKIWKELYRKQPSVVKSLYPASIAWGYKGLKHLIGVYGKTNKQIATEVFAFICPYDKASDYAHMDSIDVGAERYLASNPPVFYGYYADYDWVLFCSALFGKMIDLPKGFPMYCRDLKQMLDEKVFSKDFEEKNELVKGAEVWQRLDYLKLSPNYPKNDFEHSAIADAMWNQRLHAFIQYL